MASSTMYPSQSRLLRVADGAIVRARTFYGVGAKQIADFKERWRPSMFDGIRLLIAANKPPEEWPTTLFWNWPLKFSEAASTGSVVACCVMADRTTQGFATIRLGFEGLRRRGRPVAYVEYLQVAPWNQESLCAQPRYRGVGTALIVAAIQVSRRHGYGGRIGLHSVPESEDFYGRMCGMDKVASDPKWDGQIYFEFDDVGAARFRSRKR